jgi:hypothetical protein
MKLNDAVGVQKRQPTGNFVSVHLSSKRVNIPLQVLRTYVLSLGQER